MANSLVQKQENNVGFYIQPLSDKDHHKKTSQSRYKLKTQNKSFIFCGFCQTFQAPIHLCPETLLWYNVDYANLLLIKATTREGAERRSHLLHMRNSNNIKNAQVFPSKAKMLVSLCNDHNEYWVKKERLEYLQNHRERFAGMCQEDWEHYIKTEEFKNCGSDFKGLVNEFITRFWFGKQERIFFKEYSTQDLDKKIEDKFEQDCEAGELRYVGISTIWIRSLKVGFTVVSEAVSDTLKALITELKIERKFILAMAKRIDGASGDLGVNCCPTGILINDV